MEKKLIIATGGTGGHIFPAIALAHELEKEMPSHNILFVGGGLDTNRFFEKGKFPHQTIKCGSIIKKNPLALMKNFYGIGKGITQSLRIFKQFQPDLVVGFGSYFSFPVLFGAKLASVPFVLHEANSIPGKVIRIMSKHALVTGVHFPHTSRLLKGKNVVVGMPLRPKFKFGACSIEEAMEYFGIDSKKLTLLVFGGSQGAKALNFLISEALEKVSKLTPYQLLHFTGDTSSVVLLQEKYKSLNINAIVKPFENRMDLAWRAADLMISRAGAGTIAEQLEFEVPGILIPYPAAADNHQDYNANFMADTIGGAFKFAEKDLTPGILANKLELLFSRANEMRNNMKAHKTMSENHNLCNVIKNILFSGENMFN